MEEEHAREGGTCQCRAAEGVGKARDRAHRLIIHPDTGCIRICLSHPEVKHMGEADNEALCRATGIPSRVLTLGHQAGWGGEPQEANKSSSKDREGQD